MLKTSFTCNALILFALVSTSFAQQNRKRPARLKPTHENIKYGPHERNVFDLYLAESDKPTPLVLYIHGGGFRGGDKKTLSPADGGSYLKAGYSVAAINYRLTNVAPAPAAYMDCARALQFLRHNAKKWNLNPKLVASTGGSAGAGTSLWIAFHDDMADPKSDDPIARESTRLTCAVVRNGQSSYDPRFAEKIGLPRPNFERHSFFLPFYDITRDEIDSPKAYKRYEEFAPITHLTKDDPPAMMLYGYPNVAVTEKTSLGVIVHHPLFGIALQKEMSKFDLECVVQYANGKTRRQIRHKKGAKTMTPVEFITQQFEQAGKK
jgi:hypothetical protein